MRVARSRELVAQGRPAALVARVAGISRQAIYRRPQRPPRGQRRPLDATDREVLRVARANPTDGTRMVAALASRGAAGPVNRKRVQRLMREHRLLQPKRSEGRRRRPGYFQVTRPDELWHLDMTSVWVAEHGWCYLNEARQARQALTDLVARQEREEAALVRLKGRQVRGLDLPRGWEPGDPVVIDPFPEGEGERRAERQAAVAAMQAAEMALASHRDRNRRRQRVLRLPVGELD